MPLPRVLWSCVLGVGLTAPALPAERRPDPAAVPARPESAPGLHYRFQKVAEGVFCALPGGTAYYVSNSVVIVGEDGVLLVDSGAGPNEARVLREGIRTLTDRPVRYVVDTHFHFDHAFGHQAFPEALVVGHDATRDLLGPDALRGPTVSGYLASLPAQINNAREEAGHAADPAKRRELEERVTSLGAYQQELSQFVPTAPSLTFSDSMTIWLGRREVRLLHLGRGHTAGDLVVHLPQDRVVCTGDLFNGYIGYMGDAYVDEWAASLGRLAGLDFETVIAGHGEPFKGKEAIGPVQACLRELWRQAEQQKQAGASAEEAARRIDLRVHASRFPRLSQVGFEPMAVRRVYQVLDERASAGGAR
jgi:cyclase